MIKENLPHAEGYFFDGTFYVDFEGTKLLQHPYLEEQISYYIDDENERIGDLNRRIQKEITTLKQECAGYKPTNIFN